MTHADDTGIGQAAPSAGGRVLTLSLHRIRRGRAIALASAEPPPGPPAAPRPSPAALTLALAHEFQRLIDSGEVPDRATLAAHIGLTRARVTQVMDLLLLAPDIQEEVLFSCRGGPMTHTITERRLRTVARLPMWAEQRATAARLVAVGQPRENAPSALACPSLPGTG